MDIYLSNEEPAQEHLDKMGQLFQLQQDGSGTLSPLTIAIMVRFWMF